MKDYDLKIKRQNDHGVIEHGVIKGNKTVLLIKTGLGGSIYGYEDKYLQIANNLNEKYGATVVVADNKNVGNYIVLNETMYWLKELFNDDELEGVEIYFMGHSDGAKMGAEIGYHYKKIKKMLLINPPLMINLDKQIRGVNEFGGKIQFVFGEFDLSTQVVDVNNLANNQNIKVEIVKDADHYFKGKLQDFIDLPEKYLFDEN